MGTGTTTDPGGVPRKPPRPDPRTTPGVAAAPPAGLRRLTAQQYQNTIRALFGSSLTAPTEFDPDDTDAIFGSVGGYRIVTSPGGVLKYEDAAHAIAHQVFASPALVASTVGCDPKQGAACASSFVKAFGRRAWRRPLTAAEVARYTKLVADVSQLLGTPEAGFEYALAGLLQSPHFMYLPEVGEVANGATRYTSHELASRLSYLLTNGPPDAELSSAADATDLVTPQKLRGQFERLLATAEAKAAQIGFFGQLLQLDALADLTKDSVLYPQATPALLSAMRAEADELINQTVLAQRGRLPDLLDLKTAFVNADLAKLYGLLAPTGAGMQGVPLPARGDRGGILTTGAWLSINAKPYSSSPTKRGVWIRERLLCQEVPPPPPNVNNVLPAPADRGKTPMTTRQVLEAHRQAPQCAACHAVFDPIGVAFENFDGIGAYRTTEDKLPIDPHGELDGKAFATAGELIGILRNDPRVTECIVRHLYQFVSGRVGLPGEDRTVSGMAPAFQARPDFRDLLTQMVASEWFRAPGVEQ